MPEPSGTPVYACLHRGDIYRKTGRFAEAIKDYQKAPEIKPDNDDAKTGRREARNHDRR